jgi:hypothetical protein
VRTATTPVPLRPHRQREQSQAKRRYAQPAPHRAIIAQFDWFLVGETPPRRGANLYPRFAMKSRDKLLHLPFFLGLAAAFGFAFAAGFAVLAGFPDFLTAGTLAGAFAG